MLNLCGSQIIFWAQIFSSIATVLIAVSALIQGRLNKKTLEEMKISRIESVSPLLYPELGAKIRGVFDNETSYISDLKVVLDPSPNIEERIELTPFDITITNIGQGPACCVTVEDINNYPVNQDDKSIRIIKPDEHKQIRFSLYIKGKNYLEKNNAMKITYEDMHGEKYEQEFDFEVNSFNIIKRVQFNKPKKSN